MTSAGFSFTSPQLAQSIEDSSVDAADYISVSTWEMAIMTISVEEIGLGDQIFEEEKDMTRTEKMSHAQSRIWFLTEYLDDRRTYNATISYKINGKLDVAGFQSALLAVIERHDTFRTCFLLRSRDLRIFARHLNIIFGYLQTPTSRQYWWRRILIQFA